MCARVAYTVLAGLFVFVVATVAAFAYLPWWQALFASAATFGALVLLARYFLFRAVRRVRGAVQTALDVRGRVLKGAGVDVHAARRLGGALLVAGGTGGSGGADADAHTLEFTVFPAGSAANDPWDPADLRLVPATAAPPQLLGGAGPAEITPRDVMLVEDGAAVASGGPVRGPRRLRLTADVPRGVSALALRCGYAQFGRIDLSRGGATA